MDSDIQARFEAAYQAAVEMNRQAWLRQPRCKTEAEANQQVRDALDVLARNRYDIVPDEAYLAKIRAENYTGIGAWYNDPDFEQERWQGVTPEVRNRSEAAYQLARAMIRQEWLATGMTEKEYDEDARCTEAWHLLNGYGYKGVQLPEEEPAAPSYIPVVEKELIPQK